jgi:DNA-binding transcriptional MerR regulator
LATAILRSDWLVSVGTYRPVTGYRYYCAAQLPDLNRILAMKELGLTLEQIKRLVEDDASAEGAED